MNMTTDNLFLTGDFGTQGVRVALFDMKGNIVEMKERKYSVSYPKSGYAEQDTNELWSRFEEALSELMKQTTEEQKANIKGMTLDATSSSVLPVKKTGEPLEDAIIWMDIRAKEQARRINQTNHKVLEYCGGAVSAEWSLPKLLWYKEENTAVYNEADMIVEQLDLFNYKLTGNWVASKMIAVSKANYIDQVGYDESFMTEIGFEDYKEKLIMDVQPMGALIGYLEDEIADKFELDNIPVYQGGIDGHIGMLGLGVVEPGKMAAVMGTSFAQFVLTDQEIPVQGIWGPYIGAMIPGLTLLEGGQVSAGSLTNWFNSHFDDLEENIFDILQKEAMDIPLGSEGVRVLDFFQGNRTPYKDNYATGIIDGLTLNHTRGHIYRAILEAVAFGFKNINENFEKHGIPVDEIVASGGVTQNKLWMQIIADVTGKKFIINENIDSASSLGCAIIAAVGSGSYHSYVEAAENMVHEKETVVPNLENTKSYEEPFQEYLELYQRNKVEN
jgi:FGGY-family pentulose kinase